MKATRASAIAVFAVFPMVLLGCGQNDEVATASSTTHATSPTHSSTTAPPAPVPLADVDCGQIHGSNGASAHVIAFANGSGRAGCSDAITVASDYVGASTGAASTTVDGWYCQPQPDVQVPHVCSNAGVVIGLRGDAAPASPPPPAPAPVHTLTPAQTPKPAEPQHSTPAPAPNPAITAGGDTTNCGPVKDAGGQLRGVLAMATPEGQVGCVEAIDIATEYTNTVATSDEVTVSGWKCRAQREATVSQVCEKDGLKIGLQAV